MKENPEEWVWIDPNEGPIRAIYCENQNQRAIWMHEPVKVKRKDKPIGTTILSDALYAKYVRAIKNVDARKAIKQKELDMLKKPCYNIDTVEVSPDASSRQ